jgi:cellobiose transport system substrate-binding protein
VTVKRSRPIRAAAAIAGAATIALVATACAGGDTGDDTGGDGDLTLTVTTFGTFGYDDLYAEYEEANPGITIEATNIDTGGNARTDAFTKIAAGSGLSDVVAIEEGWLGAIMEVSDQFVDLRDHGIEDRKSDWVDFFDVGRQYQQATGKAWFDHSGFVWNAMVNQMPEGYYTSDGDLNVEGNAELQSNFELLGAAVDDGLSAAQTAWDWNGGKSFVDGSFATFVCPGWMLGVVQGQVEAGGGDAATGWDFADVFPGGAGNWGGAFLSVPESSEHQAEAAKLADWLTQPEQQVKQSAAAGNFPSTVEAQETLAADATPNEFFNGAPTGAILAERAQGIVAQFKGPDDSVIQENVFGPPLQKLDRGEVSVQQAWDEALSLLNELVG